MKRSRKCLFENCYNPCRETCWEKWPIPCCHICLNLESRAGRIWAIQTHFQARQILGVQRERVTDCREKSTETEGERRATVHRWRSPCTVFPRPTVLLNGPCLACHGCGWVWTHVEKLPSAKLRLAPVVLAGSVLSDRPATLCPPPPRAKNFPTCRAAFVIFSFGHK